MTIIHISLYPEFSLFLEETGEWLSDQVRTAVLSYATVFLLCSGIDVLWLTLGEKHPSGPIFKTLNSDSDCIEASFYTNQTNADFPSCKHLLFLVFFLSQEYVLIPCLLVHLVLHNTPVLWSFAVIVISPGVRLQLTKQFCCSGMDSALGRAIILN